jgi:hypothetical protein
MIECVAHAGMDFSDDRDSTQSSGDSSRIRYRQTYENRCLWGLPTLSWPFHHPQV